MRDCAGVILAAVLAAPCAMAAGAPSVATSADGIRIAYEARGQGRPALVFVHGWSCDKGYWKEQMEPFSGRHRVVAIDLPGHGASGIAREVWTIAAFGADIAAVVDKLGLDRVILVGHSSGGDVILEAARRLRGRVSGLVWVDVYRSLDRPRTPQQVESFVAPFRTDFQAKTRALVRGMFPPRADPALVDWVAADMSSAPTSVALPTMVAAVSYDDQVLPAIRELKLPLVAINPDATPSDLERHGISVVLMSGVGHFPMLEDPAGFNRALWKAIDKLAP